jgi:hypothetical protein
MGDPSQSPDGRSRIWPPEAPLPSDILPRLFQTQVAYRELIERGFTEEDASGLIGYAVGLSPCESRWSIGQVNRLLFLRDLYSNTGWGETERRRE